MYILSVIKILKFKQQKGVKPNITFKMCYTNKNIEWNFNSHLEVKLM